MRTIAVTVFLVLAISAHAQTPPDGGAPPDAAPAATPTKSGDEFNFELAPAPAKPNLLDETAQRKLESRVKLRRKLLTAHQALGFATLGLLAVANILGTLLYVDKYGGGTDTGDLYPYHESFAIAAATTFTATAITALVAPNPYPKPIKFDAAFVHKASMAIAAACFVTQLILGPVTAHYEGTLMQKDLALAHLVTGWGAAVFMTVGTLAYVFK
jgi:hypothetical protein